MASQAKAPLRGYETTIITRMDLSETGLSELREKISGAIKRFDGSVIVHEDWGRRRFAFKIKKESRGHYTYLAFTGNSKATAEVERMLKINEHVLRFMTVKLADEFDATEFKKNHVNFLAKGTRAEAETRYSQARGERGPGGGGGRFDRDRDRDDG